MSLTRCYLPLQHHMMSLTRCFPTLTTSHDVLNKVLPCLHNITWCPWQGVTLPLQHHMTSLIRCSLPLWHHMTSVTRCFPTLTIQHDILDKVFPCLYNITWHPWQGVSLPLNHHLTSLTRCFPTFTTSHNVLDKVFSAFMTHMTLLRRFFLTLWQHMTSVGVSLPLQHMTSMTRCPPAITTSHDVLDKVFPYLYNITWRPWQGASLPLQHHMTSLTMSFPSLTTSHGILDNEFPFPYNITWHPWQGVSLPLQHHMTSLIRCSLPLWHHMTSATRCFSILTTPRNVLDEVFPYSYNTTWCAWQCVFCPDRRQTSRDVLLLCRFNLVPGHEE